jgi:hypothetical protein
VTKLVVEIPLLVDHPKFVRLGLLSIGMVMQQVVMDLGVGIVQEADCLRLT